MSDFEYPRPQLVRDNWQSLNGSWQFAFDDERRYHRPEDAIDWTHDINVPFAPECRMSGIGDTGFHTVVWYRLEFDLPQRGQRTILHFGAVDYSCKVWINNRLVTSHEGGHTSFHADITHALDQGPHQTVVLRVEDDPADLNKPRGKQDWQLEPHSIWYPRTTGIWQTVWLEQVPETYLKSIRWTPYFDGFEIGCEIQAAGGAAMASAWK
jgi:beta-galactosidase/beta-glucuronidase